MVERRLPSSRQHCDYIVSLIVVAASTVAVVVRFLYYFLTGVRHISQHSVFILLPYFRPAAERAQAHSGPGFSSVGVGQDGGRMGLFSDGTRFSAGIGFFPSLFGLQFVRITFMLLLPSYSLSFDDIKITTLQISILLLPF